jgi:LysR family hydrogen peroxide-inducible transcriptional activator
VGELQHFGRAAERCGVSQAGLSEQLRKLEGVLGVALFERSTRRVAVTPQGATLLRQAREVLGTARALLEMAGSKVDPLSGPLRLGVIATLGPYYVPGLLRDVRARFPRLEMRLQEGLTASLTRSLQESELDAVLLALPLPEETIATVPLFFEPFRAVLPTGHPLADQPRLTLSDLAGTGLLLLEEGHCLRDQALSLCGERRPSADTRFATSLEMLRHMIAAGEGYSLLPLLATQTHPELGALLCVRTLEDESIGRCIGLAWRRTDPRAHAFAELAEFLRSTIPDGIRAVAA